MKISHIILSLSLIIFGVWFGYQLIAPEIGYDFHFIEILAIPQFLFLSVCPVVVGVLLLVDEIQKLRKHDKTDYEN